jgi:hypothetical protein
MSCSSPYNAHLHTCRMIHSSTYMYTHTYTRISIYLSIHLSIHPSVHPYIHLSPYLHVILSICIVCTYGPATGLFVSFRRPGLVRPEPLRKPAALGKGVAPCPQSGSRGARSVHACMPQKRSPRRCSEPRALSLRRLARLARLPWARVSASCVASSPCAGQRRHPRQQRRRSRGPRGRRSSRSCRSAQPQ